MKNPEAASALQDAIALVQSLRVLYQKLLTSDEYEESSVRDYIESLVNSVVDVFPSKQKIRVEKRIADFRLDSKSLFALGIIINELLSNTLKYAFNDRDSGLITIVLDKDGNHVTLTVQDNGKGLPDGFDVNESQGFGLMMVTMLAQQFGGRFTMESRDGTRSVLEFDL